MDDNIIGQGVEENMKGRIPRISVAPMVGVTTRQHRYLTRLLSRNTTLYTEMIVAESIVHGREELVNDLLDPCADGPVVLQLAGRNPANFAYAAKLAEARGFKEINMNCGCPSKRAAVSGAFGVAMMKEPELVAQIVRESKKVAQIPITVKCRLGVNDHDSYEHVSNFIRTVLDAGADRIALHARKGVLGLNTKNNRSVPPLRYDWVYKLCEEFSETPFDINGGINSLEEAKLRLKESNNRLDGVMLGRCVWRDPLILANADTHWFGKSATGLPQTRRELLEMFCDKFATEKRVFDTTEALQGLFLGTPGASAFRKGMGTQRKGETLETIVSRAIENVPSSVLDRHFREEDEEIEARHVLSINW
jgi:tRNA-dihydrouridine synthase A